MSYYYYYFLFTILLNIYLALAYVIDIIYFIEEDKYELTELYIFSRRRHLVTKYKHNINDSTTIALFTKQKFK